MLIWNTIAAATRPCTSSSTVTFQMAVWDQLLKIPHGQTISYAELAHRVGRPTAWRGGNAKDMKQEFEVYGLPAPFVKVVGFLKLLFATMLIVGIWVPALVQPAAIGLATLMLGAVAMHLKVKVILLLLLVYLKVILLVYLKVILLVHLKQ